MESFIGLYHFIKVFKWNENTIYDNATIRNMTFSLVMIEVILTSFFLQISCR